MTALTSERKIATKTGELNGYGVAAATKLWGGGLVCLNSSGYAVKGSEADALVCVGVAVATVDNTAGANADLDVEVMTGEFKFENSAGGDEIGIDDIGKTAYIVDDQTVALTAGTVGRSKAGRVVLVETDGVWVKVGPDDAKSASGLLSMPDAAALNGTATTRVVAPSAGILRTLYSVASGALATGPATLTFGINGTPVTGGVITIALGGAAGDVDSASPSAAHVLAAGDVIECTVGGSNTAAETAAVSMLIDAI